MTANINLIIYNSAVRNSRNVKHIAGRMVIALLVYVDLCNIMSTNYQHNIMYDVRRPNYPKRAVQYNNNTI